MTSPFCACTSRLSGHLRHLLPLVGAGVFIVTLLLTFSASTLPLTSTIQQQLKCRRISHCCVLLGASSPPIRSSARTDNGRIADGQRFLQDTPLMRTQIRSPFLNTTHDFLEDPWLSHRLFQLLRNRLLKPPLLMKVCVCDFPPSRYYTLDLMCEGCPRSGRKY